MISNLVLGYYDAIFYLLCILGSFVVISQLLIFITIIMKKGDKNNEWMVSNMVVSYINRSINYYKYWIDN